MKVKVVLGFIVFIALVLALDYGGFLWGSVMMPKREALRREVFENTRSFNEAKLQQISKYKFEFDRAENEESKRAVRSVVRNTFSDYSINDLPTELQYFIQECRGY
jgi:hypothetical protein